MEIKNKSTKYQVKGSCINKITTKNEAVEKVIIKITRKTGNALHEFTQTPKYNWMSVKENKKFYFEFSFKSHKIEGVCFTTTIKTGGDTPNIAADLPGIYLHIIKSAQA